MSGIAEVLLNLGYRVSGSDLKASALTQRLAHFGAMTFEGHRAENIKGAEVVVTSSAIARDNPEVAEAHRLKIPVIQRAEMLAELMRLKYGIAIAGMHGKTTVTSMVAAVLAAGNLDPTVVVGGRVDALGSNARLGKSQYIVAEADESDRSFLKLAPILSVVTNIDREHLDTYRDMKDVEDTFVDFMDRVPFYGMIVACNDDEPLRALLPRLRRRYVTYGKRQGSDFRLTSATSELEPGMPKPLSRFGIEFNGKPLGEFSLHVPGQHNILNATAAVAVGVGLEIPIYSIQYALETFRGVDRRFQLRGEVDGVRVVDDYGHQPTEIQATLEAARQVTEGKIHVIFQPHRFTRTQALLEEFAGSFSNSDNLFVLDIYPASEQPIPGINGELVAQKVAARGRPAVFVSSFADAVAMAASAAKPGDLIMTLGAGNVSQLGPQLVEALRSKHTVQSA